MCPRFYRSKRLLGSGIRVVEETPIYKEESVGPNDTSQELQNDIAEMYSRGAEDDKEEDEDEDEDTDQDENAEQDD
jgi:hypothetical protein